MPINRKTHIEQAIQLLTDLGMPRQQCNQRTALCLLALLDLTPDRAWGKAQSPLIGITPIMDWSRNNYAVRYAPNTRETFRRQSMHQLMQAGIARYNPDEPERPVNSPYAVYQINLELLEVLRQHGKRGFRRQLENWINVHGALSAVYAAERQQRQIPVRFNNGQSLKLSTGKHSALIKQIVESFAQRFAPDSQLIYVGDTAHKWAYFDQQVLAGLGVTTDNHGKMPDVILFDSERNWLLVIESVTTHGPVDAKRHQELAELFQRATVGIVYVSAFPDRRTLNKYLEMISWETEVWIADAPSHLIHFNGLRFLGPYAAQVN
jgi:hypothetical protein